MNVVLTKHHVNSVTVTVIVTVTGSVVCQVSDAYPHSIRYIWYYKDIPVTVRFRYDIAHGVFYCCLLLFLIHLKLELLNLTFCAVIFTIKYISVSAHIILL